MSTYTVDQLNGNALGKRVGFDTDGLRLTGILTAVTHAYSLESASGRLTYGQLGTFGVSTLEFRGIDGEVLLTTDTEVEVFDS